MPRIKSKQVIGETPVNPNDLTTKEYVDNLVASGTTGGSLIIEDEGVVVSSGATIINFIGVDVTAQDATSGTTKRVNVYIPPPDYVSNYNTTNGTSNASVSPVSTTNRYVALPDSEGTPYKIGAWVPGSTQSTIRNAVNNLNYSTTGEFSIFDLTTTFTAIVYDADGTTPLATHTTGAITTDDTTVVDNITILINNFGTDADRYKAEITVTIDLATILPQGGRFSISLTHNNSVDGTYSFTQNNVFRDVETLAADLTGASLTAVPTTPVISWISGVQYYTTNSTWHVHLDNINELNSISYPTTQQLTIDDDDRLLISETLNAHGEGGSYYAFVGGTWTQQHDTTNAEFDKTDWTTDQINSTNWNHSTGDIIRPSYFSGSIYDWSTTASATSPQYEYLLDTFENNSDRNSELFRREDHATYPRLESDLVTPWDSTDNILLGTTDSGTGLQLLADRLVYPQIDFSSYLPSPQPSYTASSGDKYYYRQFDTNGANVSNGIIVFSDHNISEADLSAGNIVIEINLNEGLGWHTLNSPYVSGVLNDGDGCRVDPGVYSLDTTNSIRFTLGQLQPSPPAGTATTIYMRITYTIAAATKYIGGIDITDGNWD